jgi:glycosyltransferase involved in cell wall biosynthesis
MEFMKKYFETKKGIKDKKNLLIYAHYYYPDVASTGQILTELAEGLADDFNVTVICTVPSYTGVIEDRYKTQRFYEEEINGVKVLRIRVPEFKKSNTLSRIRNIMSYYFGALSATKQVGPQDLIYTISQPPLLGGILGVYGKRKKRAKLVYNIQDFNPEQMEAVSFVKNKAMAALMRKIDNRSCKRADKVIVVGRDMVETLKKRFPNKMPSYAHINNWINEDEIVPLPADNERVQAFKKQYGLDGKFIIMYSGNIGLYYDLLEIQKIMGEFADQEDVRFVFVGQGSVLDEMKDYCRANKLSNMVFIPYQNKEDLVYSLNAGDVHLVVNAKGIKGVSVPSKIYGVMAAGKPVLGILEKGSEARIIVEESDCGVVVDPEDYDAIRKTILYYIENRGSMRLQEMGTNGRAFLDANLKRETSIRKYAEELKNL